jgi:glucose/arabinose dehydrogenase
MDMKRLIVFACSLAFASACSGAPAAQASNQLASAPADAAAKPAAAPAEASTPAASTNPIKKMLGAEPAYREVTLPAGTVLPIDLETTVGSDISRVEQPVSGRLRRAVMVGGAEVLPAGTAVSGHVTAAQRPGKVKGRGLIAMRFTQLDTPGAGTTRISTATISRLAPATKQKDTLQIVGPAAAGAVIGRIAGGKSGAAKGAVIGGGAGAGYVLATRGKDVRIAKGADLAVKLTAPVTVRVPVR